MIVPIEDEKYIQIGWWNFDGESMGFAELDEVLESDQEFWSPAFALKKDAENHQ